MNSNDKVIRLRETTPAGPSNTDLPGFLRALATQVESGEMPSKSAAVIFVCDREEATEFTTRMRRHNLHFLGVIGALEVMLHDMKHC
jgi:hypothetical protein